MGVQVSRAAPGFTRWVIEGRGRLRRIDRIADSLAPMSYVISAALLVIAVIHLLPAIGMLSAARVAGLYGIPVDEPNLELLLRHRAVLFAWLGGFCVVAAFQPRYQGAALLAAGVSVLSFLVLAYGIGGLNAALLRVVRADLVAAVALAIGAGAWLWQAGR